jgi:exonuclease VII small subunit
MAVTANEFREEERKEIKELQNVCLLLSSTGHSMQDARNFYADPEHASKLVDQAMEELATAKKELKDAMKWDSRIFALIVALEKQLKTTEPGGKLTATMKKDISLMKSFEHNLQNFVKQIPGISKRITFVKKTIQKKAGYSQVAGAITPIERWLFDTNKEIRNIISNIIWAISTPR